MLDSSLVTMTKAGATARVDPRAFLLRWAGEGWASTAFPGYVPPATPITAGAASPAPTPASPSPGIGSLAVWESDQAMLTNVENMPEDGWAFAYEDISDWATDETFLAGAEMELESGVLIITEPVVLVHTIRAQVAGGGGSGIRRIGVTERRGGLFGNPSETLFPPITNNEFRVSEEADGLAGNHSFHFTDYHPAGLELTPYVAPGNSGAGVAITWFVRRIG